MLADRRPKSVSTPSQESGVSPNPGSKPGDERTRTSRRACGRPAFSPEANLELAASTGFPTDNRLVAWREPKPNETI